MEHNKSYTPVVLVILDGWGISSSQDNVIKKTPLPTIEKLNKYYPLIALQSSGISVGLPWGEAGNSEVGHMTIGAGKIIYQNLPRISLAIQDGSFFRNEILLKAFHEAKKNDSALHLIGLMSDGAVHAHMEHLYALIEMAKKEGLQKVFIHAFTDGRDSMPTSGTAMFISLQEKLKEYGCGTISSVSGRHFAMDRNNNWERVEKVYRMLTEGKGRHITNPISYLQESYTKDITDEYIEPANVVENGKPLGLIADKDSVIFFNFREDRARELTKAFALPGFEKFSRPKQLDLTFVTLTEYEKDLPVSIAFPPEAVTHSLGELLSKKNKKQFRIAETEKYAHVTYFFNGGGENALVGETRVLVPSAAVERFDKLPEMSAPQITEKTIDAINSRRYDFILLNYANADMVAHTGNEKAAQEAIKTVDKSLSLLIPVVLKVGGCLFITSDHGNVETMRDFNTGEIDTEHNANPVPLWFISSDNHHEKTSHDIVKQESEVKGLLSDIAPTILEVMHLEKPEEMHGESLLPILK